MLAAASRREGGNAKAGVLAPFGDVTLICLWDI